MKRGIFYLSVLASVLTSSDGHNPQTLQDSETFTFITRRGSTGLRGMFNNTHSDSAEVKNFNRATQYFVHNNLILIS